jgi:hypothetical protein
LSCCPSPCKFHPAQETSSGQENNSDQEATTDQENNNDRGDFDPSQENNDQESNNDHVETVTNFEIIGDLEKLLLGQGAAVNLLYGQSAVVIKVEAGYDPTIGVLKILHERSFDFCFASVTSRTNTDEAFQPERINRMLQDIAPNSRCYSICFLTIPNKETTRCRSLLEAILDRVRGGMKVKAVVRLLLKAGETFNTEDLASSCVDTGNSLKSWIESLDKESQTAFFLKTGILGNVDEISVSSSDEQEAESDEEDGTNIESDSGELSWHPEDYDDEEMTPENQETDAEMIDG